MSLSQKYLYLILSTWLIAGCNVKKDNSEISKKIDLTYPEIENLIAIADCMGPGLKYVTEVHSTADGYSFFRQEHEGKENFTAVIFDGELGFQLNDSLQRLDTLSKESIAIIRGHEFHKIHIAPHEYFQGLVYLRNEPFYGADCEQYKGVDELGNKIELYYSRKNKRIEGLKFQNARDTTQQIEVIYKEWMNHKIGPLAKHVDIIQDETDIYQFDFAEVMVNDPDFKKIEL